ncbi:MAG: hypothetical protein CMP20_01860 [Rickettsiales bacterium]|nr:hypothetical protein [Rickettsiales bacterium]
MKRLEAFGIWLVCTLAFGLFAWKFSDDFPILFGVETHALNVTKEFFERFELLIDWLDRAFVIASNENMLIFPLHVVAILFCFVIVGLYFALFLPFVVGLNVIYLVESLTGWSCVVFWTSLVSFWVAGGLYQRLDAQPVKEE